MDVEIHHVYHPEYSRVEIQKNEDVNRKKKLAFSKIKTANQAVDNLLGRRLLLNPSLQI